jgi:hypothetical protein
VPASPELVIEYDAILEKRESEVMINGVGALAYTLALSVQPAATVNVIVTKDAEPTANCVNYTDGLSIEHQLHFAFNSSNWNTAQTVQIKVRRDVGIFQGTSFTRFLHSVQSDDPNWAAPFLRPMRVTITDDDECVLGALKFGVDSRFPTCGCAEGFYIEDSDPYYCSSVTKCGACPDGMLCDFQQHLTQAHLQKGFYRTRNDTAMVVRCPGLSWQCVGDATHGDSLCAPGHEGPFCMLCKLDDSARYARSGEKCLPCDSKQESIVLLVLVAFGLLLCGIIVYISYRGAAKSPGQEHENRRQKSILFDSDAPGRWESFILKSTVKCKIVVTFAQILNKLTVVYPMSLPPTFMEYHANTKFLGLVDIDIIPLNCLLDVNFHDKLMAMTIVPIVFVALVGTLYAIQRIRLSWQADGVDKQKELGLLQAKCVFVVLTFLYTAFPILSALVIQSFVYDGRLEDGREFLIADYSFQREDSSQQAMQVYAILMGLLYCIGVPASSYALLRWKKEAIQNLQALEVRIIHAREGSPKRPEDTEVGNLVAVVSTLCVCVVHRGGEGGGGGSVVFFGCGGIVLMVLILW